MDHHASPSPGSKSLYLALGIAGALVGARVADALEFGFLGLGTITGAILGAAFFIIGWGSYRGPNIASSKRSSASCPFGVKNGSGSA